MTSAQDHKSVTKPAILFVGRPGDGKTTTALMFPNIYVLECDNNIDGPLEYLRSKNLRTTARFDIPHIDDKGALVPRDQRFQRLCDLINKGITEWPEMEWIFIDSLTGLIDYMIDEIKRQQKVKIGDPMKGIADGLFERQHWGALALLILHFFLNLRASGKGLIVAAHVNAEKDEINGYLREFINIPGKSRDDLARSFTECWRLSKICDGSPPTTKVFAETVATTATQQTIGLKSARQLPAKWQVDLEKITTLFSK